MKAPLQLEPPQDLREKMWLLYSPLFVPSVCWTCGSRAYTKATSAETPQGPTAAEHPAAKRRWTENALRASALVLEWPHAGGSAAMQVGRTWLSV